MSINILLRPPSTHGVIPAHRTQETRTFRLQQLSKTNKCQPFSRFSRSFSMLQSKPRRLPVPLVPSMLEGIALHPLSYIGYETLDGGLFSDAAT